MELYSFPGESTGQAGGDIFASDGFTDLGSADVGDNPFADMEAAAAAAPKTPVDEPLAQAPAPQPQPQQAQPAPRRLPIPGGSHKHPLPPKQRKNPIRSWPLWTSRI